MPFLGLSPIPAHQRYLIKENEGIDPLRKISDLNSEFPKSVAEIFHLGMELFPQKRINNSFEYKVQLQQKKGDKYIRYIKWPTKKRTHKLPESFII